MHYGKDYRRFPGTTSFLDDSPSSEHLWVLLRTKKKKHLFNTKFHFKKWPLNNLIFLFLLQETSFSPLSP